MGLDAEVEIELSVELDIGASCILEASWRKRMGVAIVR